MHHLHGPLSIIHYPFLPDLPLVAVKVLEARGDSEVSIDEVVKLINSEPGLMARVLQLVENPARSVSAGFEAVRSAVLAICVFQQLGNMPDHGGRFSRQEFWKHSMAVGCCAELLAEQQHAIDGNESAVSVADAFVCGLLHDIGKIALDAMFPKSYARAVEAADLVRGNIADLEQSIIGMDHLVIGKRLAERWNLPLCIRECIWLHGQVPAALPATVKHPRLVNLITLADLLVRQQQLGYSGNYVFPVSQEQPAAAVGLNDEAINAAVNGLATRIEERQVAFPTPLPCPLPECRARGQAALHTIVSTAQEFLAGSIAVFSRMPAQGLADVLLACGGDEPQLLLVDCPTRPSLPSTSDGPVRVVGDDMEWLMSAISPRFDGEYRYWIGLEADGQCIGGVVWGGAAGEAPRVSAEELAAFCRKWSMALATSQIRQEANLLAEQLVQANRQLLSVQNQAMQEQMLVAIGEMAAGAAHEMNNPLAVISGRSQLLAGQLTNPRQRTMAQQIYEQSQRLSDIISDLMDYAKPQPAKPRLCTIADLIEESRRLAKLKGNLADRTIELELTGTPKVTVDPSQVSAALAEVMANACQATEQDSGRVKIQSAFDPHSSRVVITIADNGCGMDEHVLKHAFDPFFSHQQAGRRRGMGLSKALRWIEANGGSIRLESKPLQGTRCVILFNG